MDSDPEDSLNSGVARALTNPWELESPPVQLEEEEEEKDVNDGIMKR